MNYDLIRLTRKYKRVGVDLVFVDEETIHELNKKYRNIDKVTTVLSFYQGQATPEGAFNLGEVVICPDKAEKEGLGLSTLVKHGIKNLLSEVSPADNLRTGLG